MKFPDCSGITAAKVEDLRVRIGRLGIDLSRLEEKFVKGGGPGGQKRNKTANSVQIHDPDRNLTIRATRDRKRSINRFIALRELVDRIESMEVPGASRKDVKIDRLRKKKANRRKKSRRKYG